MPNRGTPCVACGKYTENVNEIKVTRSRAPDYRLEKLGIGVSRNKLRVTNGVGGVTFITNNVCDECAAAVRNYFELVWEARKAGRI